MQNVCCDHRNFVSLYTSNNYNSISVTCEKNASHDMNTFPPRWSYPSMNKVYKFWFVEIPHAFIVTVTFTRYVVFPQTKTYFIALQDYTEQC